MTDSCWFLGGGGGQNQTHIIPIPQHYSPCIREWGFPTPNFRSTLPLSSSFANSFCILCITFPPQWRQVLHLLVLTIQNGIPHIIYVCVYTITCLSASVCQQYPLWWNTHVYMQDNWAWLFEPCFLKAVVLLMPSDCGIMIHPGWHIKEALLTVCPSIHPSCVLSSHIQCT